MQNRRISFLMKTFHEHSPNCLEHWVGEAPISGTKKGPVQRETNQGSTKMKTQPTTTITNNEDQVRFQIAEGEMPKDAFYEEMLRYEREQHKNTRAELHRLRDYLLVELEDLERQLKELTK